MTSSSPAGPGSRPTLTNEAGAPVTDNQNSQSAGPGGPLLLQDQHLTQKLAHFNREEIPERIVHAVGIAAGGTFEVTHDVSGLTRAHFLGEVGRRTEVFARFGYGAVGVLSAASCLLAAGLLWGLEAPVAACAAGSEASRSGGSVG